MSYGHLSWEHFECGRNIYCCVESLHWWPPGWLEGLCFNLVTCAIYIQPGEQFNIWIIFQKHCGLDYHGWVGVGGFSKVVATFSHVGGSFNLFMATTRDVWIIPSFLIWSYVLHVEHVSCVIVNCGQYQWSVSHPFSFLNSSLGLPGQRHYQKITIPIFRLVL